MRVPPPGIGLRPDGAPLGLDDLGHDGQPETRSRAGPGPTAPGRSGRRCEGGPRARCRGRGRGPRPPRRGRARRPTCPGGLHLRALSSRLPTARERRSPSAATQHSSETRSNVTPCVRPWVVATATASRDEQVEAEGFLAHGQLVAPRQLGQVAHQVGQLLQLDQDIVDQHRAIGLGELVDPADDLEIGAQAGERGAQLVGGIDDELDSGRAGRTRGPRAAG